MDETRLRRLLDDVALGRLTTEQAVQQLRRLPFEDLGFARIDHHRALRRGFPEVVLGLGKSFEQLHHVLGAMLQSDSAILATRIEPDMAERLRRALSPDALEFDSVAHCLFRRPDPPIDRGRGPVAVLSAGTSDVPVAEEAALTAELMGNRVERVYDVGVAGIHRLFAHLETLQRAEVLVVVAGMEGALPSVVSGLVAKPVVAVPTSVGYGASLGGLTALLAMLNSCAAGVTVVNVDNGFGAGYAAALINRASQPHE